MDTQSITVDQIVAVAAKLPEEHLQKLLANLQDSQLVEYYRLLRDLRDAEKAVFVDANKPTLNKMVAIENELKGRLNARGATSIATPVGTAYKTTVVSVKTKDWPAFLEWVIENERFDVLEHRASKTEVEAIVGETGELPPGLAMDSRTNLNVKKPTAKIS